MERLEKQAQDAAEEAATLAENALATEERIFQLRQAYEQLESERLEIVTREIEAKRKEEAEKARADAEREKDQTAQSVSREAGRLIGGMGDAPNTIRQDLQNIDAMLRDGASQAEIKLLTDAVNQMAEFARRDKEKAIIIQQLQEQLRNIQ